MQTLECALKLVESQMPHEIQKEFLLSQYWVIRICTNVEYVPVILQISDT